jgi:hypothetical protein
LSAIASIIVSSIVFNDLATGTANNSKIFGIIYGIYRILPSIQQYYASENLISSHYFELRELIDISKFNINRKESLSKRVKYDEKYKNLPLVFVSSRFLFSEKEFNISIPNEIKILALNLRNTHSRYVQNNKN